MPKSARLALAQAHADQRAVARARIARHFHSMLRAGEARIIHDFAAKLAALALCLRPDQLFAARHALCLEREAALASFRQEMRASEIAQRSREVGMLRARQREERRALRAGFGYSGLRRSGVRRRFRRVGRHLTRRLRKARYRLRRNLVIAAAPYRPGMHGRPTHPVAKPSR